MNIWLRTGDPPSGATSVIRFGRFLEAGGKDDRQGPALSEIGGVADIDSRNGDIAAWYVGPGHRSDPEILEALAGSGKAVLLDAGQDGDNALDAPRRAIPTASLVLTADLCGHDDAWVFQRLAVLSAQPESFAAIADRATVIMAAVAMGASDVVVPDASCLDAAALSRIADARMRASSTNDVAAVESVERLRCLSVRRTLAAGERILEDDLTVAVTDYRGLGPAMRSHVIGLTLRYPIEPGDAIHFGHFHDRCADER